MRAHAPVLVLIVVVAGGIFINALGAEFIWDDHYTIVRNEQIRDLRRAATSFGPGYWRRIREIGGPMAYRDYRPVQEVSFAADYAVWGLNPAGYHITSILVHVANAVLLYFLAHRILGSRRGAAFCALLFAAHPVHVEPIVWTGARSALLALLFMLASMLLYLRHIEHPRTRPGAVLHMAALACFALALCSKASALVLPAVLAVYVWRFPVPGRRWAYLALLPFVAIAAALFALNQALPEQTENVLRLPLRLHLLTAVGTVGVYLRLLVMPVGLCLVHHFGVPQSAWDPQVLRALPWGLALLAGIVVAFRRSRVAFLALAWMLIAMAPVSNLVILGRPIAEPRAYVPSVGFCLLVGLLLLRLPELARARSAHTALQRLSLALCVSTLALYSGLTVVRNLDWADRVRLYRDTLAKNPRSATAHFNLAGIYVQQNRPQLALPHLRETIALAPAHEEARDKLATLCRQMALHDEAIGHYVWLRDNGPPDVQVHIGLGVCYVGKGWRESAMAEFEEALAIDPQSYHAHYNLGLIHIGKREYEQAAAELRRAVALAPERAAAHHHLGVAHHRMGHKDLALREYKEALRLRADNPETWLAVGACYQELGNDAEAVRSYQRCIELGGVAAEEAARRVAELTGARGSTT